MKRLTDKARKQCLKGRAKHFTRHSPTKQARRGRVITRIGAKEDGKATDESPQSPRPEHTKPLLMELFGGGLAMTGATMAAISSNSEKSTLGVYVGVGCILIGWAVFSISQIEANGIEK